MGRPYEAHYGIGKTTLASTIAHALNEKYKKSSPGAAAGSSQPIASFIPMDGYHLTRAQLSAMADPTNAHARRGAAFTFDGQAYHELIKKLREPILPESGTLYAPSFDHAVKDPVENDIAIGKGTRVLIFEGNYVALDQEPWKDAAALMDEIWFVEVNMATARKRLVSRHVKAGIAKDEEEAGRRADENDLVNGKEIMDHRVQVHEVIQSIDDDAWKPEEQRSEQ